MVIIFFINILLWVLSHFPVFCLSYDNNFANLNYDIIKKHKNNLRISMFNLMLGDCILYLITYDIKNRKFEFYHVLFLKNVDSLYLSDEKIDEIQDRYKEHIKDLSKEDLEIEKEKLIYHIQNENSRIDTSVSKINIYTTVILTASPVVLAILNLKDIVRLPLPILVCVVLIVYSLLNICIYIFNAVKVGGIKKSSFNDLRLSQKKDKCILLQYQYDWQQLRYKALLFVSFVINIQEWFMLMLALLSFVLIGNSYFVNNKTTIDKSEDYGTVTTIDLNEIDMPYSYSSIEWKKLLLYIEQRECKSVVLLVNPHGEISFVDELDKYEELDSKVYTDETIEKDILKIIMEDE